MPKPPTPKKPGRSGKLVSIATAIPTWPEPTVPLRDEHREYRDRILRAVHASRGVLASDVVACDHAAAAAQDAARWRKIGDLLLSDARKAKRHPDLRALAQASARAEAATRSHSSITRALGIRGDRLGTRRVGIVNALESVTHPDSDWIDPETGEELI